MKGLNQQDIRSIWIKRIIKFTVYRFSSEKLSGPDGIEAWTVALAACVISFVNAGLARMSGILYVAFIDIYHIDRREASLPFSVRSSMRNLFGMYFNHYYVLFNQYFLLLFMYIDVMYTEFICKLFAFTVKLFLALLKILISSLRNLLGKNLFTLLCVSESVLKFDLYTQSYLLRKIYLATNCI